MHATTSFSSPDARHVVVHLVALQATAVFAAQQALSQSPGSMTPQAFSLSLHVLQPQWPNDGTLVVQLNAGQPEERSWFTSDLVRFSYFCLRRRELIAMQPTGKSLDVSSAISAGMNSLRILQLRNMAELVFVLYAAPPTGEMLAAAIDLERQHKMYLYHRPRSERLLG